MKKISIGALLKQRRKELSLTQRQIAQEVGVTETTVSRWEFGDIDNMRRDKIAGSANALKLALGYYLDAMNRLNNVVVLNVKLNSMQKYQSHFKNQLLPQKGLAKNTLSAIIHTLIYHALN